MRFAHAHLGILYSEAKFLVLSSKLLASQVENVLCFALWETTKVKPQSQSMHDKVNLNESHSNPVVGLRIDNRAMMMT